MPDVMIPTIHLNGSGAEYLRDAACSAARALNAALDALCEMGPNARDYYPQGPDAAFQAGRAHEDRIKRLRNIRDEVIEIHTGIVDAIDAR